jgi:MFS family permease
MRLDAHIKEVLISIATEPTTLKASPAAPMGAGQLLGCKGSVAAGAKAGERFAVEDGACAGRREWLGLAVLALACVLYAMDLTVLHLAVPRLSADLRPTGAQLLWIIDVYGFLVAGSLITMGTLGDRVGRRKLLLIGAAAFSAASVLAAFSTSAEMLIAGRALMGVAGATLAPSALALIFSMFRDPGQRSVAIGVWISAFSAGGAVGPLLGGVLLEYFWWGSVFLLALPVMAPLLALGPRVLPSSATLPPGASTCPAPRWRWRPWPWRRWPGPMAPPASLCSWPWASSPRWGRFRCSR